MYELFHKYQIYFHQWVYIVYFHNPFVHSHIAKIYIWDKLVPKATVLLVNWYLSRYYEKVALKGHCYVRTSVFYGHSTRLCCAMYYSSTLHGTSF